jgi:hypothetical protein
MARTQNPRLSLALAAYTAPGGARHTVGVLALGALPGAGRPRAARVAAALARSGGLVLDRAPGEPLRLVGTLEAGEGLACAQALVADYLPRARRATAALARPLAPADLRPHVLEERAA